MKVVLADLPLKSQLGEAVTEAPNLGILYLISYARKYCPKTEFTYLQPFLSEQEHLDLLSQIRPDIYGLSYTTPKREMANQLCKKLLSYNQFIIGGAHPTVAPYEALEETGAQGAVVGEGEEAFTNILRYYPRLNGIPNVAIPKGKHSIYQSPLKDINFFPAWDMINFEDYDIPLKQNYPVAYLLPSRGCPNNCTFCSSPVWKLCKPWIRHRNPQNIASEVAYLYNRGVREIYIRSDTFNSDLNWANNVCKAIIKLGFKDLTFQCNLRADSVSKDFVQNLKKMGCWLTHVGIESYNDRVLKGIGKNVTAKSIDNTLKLLKIAGIKSYGFLMLYNLWENYGVVEEETTNEVQNTLQFAKHSLDNDLLTYISWSMTNPIVGSKLHDIANAHNLCSNEKYLPIKSRTISKREKLQMLRKGMMLQLQNGFNRNIIKPNDMRAFNKFKALLEILNLEDECEQLAS